MTFEFPSNVNEDVPLLLCCDLCCWFVTPGIKATKSPFCLNLFITLWKSLYLCYDDFKVSKVAFRCL